MRSNVFAKALLRRSGFLNVSSGQELFPTAVCKDVLTMMDSDNTATATNEAGLAAILLSNGEKKKTARSDVGISFGNCSSKKGKRSSKKKNT